LRLLFEKRGSSSLGRWRRLIVLRWRVPHGVLGNLFYPEDPELVPQGWSGLAGSNSVPREFEELSMNAWPALQTLVLDGWVLRFSNGYSKRANSTMPLYQGTGDVNGKIAACERFYSERGLDTIFKLTTASSPPELDAILSERGYSLQGRTSVQTLDLAAEITGHPEPEVKLSEDLTDEWLTALALVNGIDATTKETAGRMLLNIAPSKCFG
jgi:hypothetical protein